MLDLRALPGRSMGMSPLLGQNKFYRVPVPSLGTTWAAERAPGTPSGPSKNRSERKTELLILHLFYHQIWSPGILLQIPDPSKRPPMDLVTFSEGPLGSCRGVPRLSRDPPWTLGTPPGADPIKNIKKL